MNTFESADGAWVNAIRLFTAEYCVVESCHTPSTDTNKVFEDEIVTGAPPTAVNVNPVSRHQDE